MESSSADKIPMERKRTVRLLIGSLVAHNNENSFEAGAYRASKTPRPEHSSITVEEEDEEDLTMFATFATFVPIVDTININYLHYLYYYDPEEHF